MPNLYARHILPRAIDKICALKPTRKQREKVIPLAEGSVLEIGIGSGLNLPFYDPEKVRSVTGIDPVSQMWSLKQVDPDALGFEVAFHETGAHAIPSETDAFDTIVITYTLCTIGRLDDSFSEIRRVLKPGGQLIFTEHGRAPDRSVRRWQNLINPLWRPLAGGCNLNRDIPRLIEEHGLVIDRLDTMYIPGWKPACFNYWGVAHL